MNPQNRKLSETQVLKLRDLVWVKGLPYAQAAQAVGINTPCNKVSGNTWAAIHGYTFKTAGGPTGRRA